MTKEEEEQVAQFFSFMDDKHEEIKTLAIAMNEAIPEGKDTTVVALAIGMMIASGMSASGKKSFFTVISNSVKHYHNEIQKMRQKNGK